MNLILTGNATQALEFVDQNHVEAVVVGSELPDMTGLRLLDLVFQHNPSVHRFLVVDADRRQSSRVSASIAHFLIRAPLSSSRLTASLDRANQLTEWFGPGFATQILSRLRKIPSPPLPYFRALTELDSPEVSLEKLSATIAQHADLASKMMDMVNSPAFQLPRPLASIDEVVRMLGMDAATTMALVAHLFCQFNRISPYLFPLEGLRRHALYTGRLARALARAERMPVDVQDRAFLAGLLHDAGKLLLAANAPDTYGRINAEIRFGFRSFTDVEREALGMSHAEVGAWLAGVWDLPMDVVAALAFHHEPRQLAKMPFSIPHIVHVANILAHQVQLDLPGGQVPQLDESMLLKLGIAGRVQEWSRLASNLVDPAEDVELSPRLVAA